MKVTINGIEFAKTGTIGCRWISTHEPGTCHENMMTDDACDQIAALTAEVERLRRVRDAAAEYRAAKEGYMNAMHFGPEAIDHDAWEDRIDMAARSLQSALDAAEGGG